MLTISVGYIGNKLRENEHLDIIKTQTLNKATDPL